MRVVLAVAVLAILAYVAAAKRFANFDKLPGVIRNKNVLAKPFFMKKAVEKALPELESDLNNGAALQATAALNVRRTACTSGAKVTTVAAGARMTYTGTSKTACGYTWYSVRGSFGSGYVASNYVRSASTPSRPAPRPTSRPAPRPAPATPRGNRSYPLFKQCDSRWGGNRLGSSTVCKIGCLMSSVSMALNGLGKSIEGQSSNPGVLNRYLSSHGGYSGNLFIWSAVAKFGLKYAGQTTDKNALHNAVKQGKVVVLNVRGGGHWVLAVASTGSGFTVNDPGFSVGSYTNAQVVRGGIYNL